MKKTVYGGKKGSTMKGPLNTPYKDACAGGMKKK